MPLQKSDPEAKPPVPIHQSKVSRISLRKCLQINGNSAAKKEVVGVIFRESSWQQNILF
jgi:hypothetical protein